jgi:hypothetical protein
LPLAVSPVAASAMPARASPAREVARTTNSGQVMPAPEGVVWAVFYETAAAGCGGVGARSERQPFRSDSADMTPAEAFASSAHKKPCREFLMPQRCSTREQRSRWCLPASVELPPQRPHTVPTDQDVPWSGPRTIKAPTRLRQWAFAHQSRLPERNEDDESGVWLRRFRDVH